MQSVALPALLCTGRTVLLAFRKHLWSGIPRAGSDGIWGDLEAERTVQDQQHAGDAGSRMKCVSIC